MNITAGEWDASPARYTDPEYARACLIDRGTGAVEARCLLPVLEPDGTLNRNALDPAAAALAGTLRDVTDTQRTFAARKLAGYYTTAGMEPPADLLNLVDTVARTERRSAELMDPQVNGLSITGYAAVFDTPWSDVLTDQLGYQEVVSRGAFRKVLAEKRNVPLLWRHREDDVLATTRAGTLRLKEDGRGLAVNATLPDSTRGRDIAALVANGTVGGMSFGFKTTRADSQIDRSTLPPTRRLRSMRALTDVSLTWDPAYDSTSAELRAEQFAAVTFEDLVGGVERQTVQVDERVDFASTAKARLRAIQINELEAGGI